MPDFILHDESQRMQLLVSMRRLLLVGQWSWKTLRPLFHWPQHRGRHPVRNRSVAVFNAVVTGAVFGTVTVLTAGWTVENQFGVLPYSQQYPMVRFVSGWILLDGWMYFWHRLNHRFPLLWRVHRMHHSDPKMDVTSATRLMSAST
jgi:sterol desaturase/sphingolipid hydroxylase (fatty acid hydroxylase superfamily)